MGALGMDTFDTGLLGFSAARISLFAGLPVKPLVELLLVLCALFKAVFRLALTPAAEAAEDG